MNLKTLYIEININCRIFFEKKNSLLLQFNNEDF